MQTTQLPVTQFLGPAKVVRVEGARVLLCVNATQVWARTAVGYPYAFQVDDEVLTIGQHDDWYVIGVLHGSGKTTLQVPGNLQLLAPQGSIEMVAAQGISLRGPRISLTAIDLSLVAKRFNQRFEQAKLWVKGGLEVIAQRMSTRVDKSYRMHAGKIVQRAVGDVKMDGKKIHLG